MKIDCRKLSDVDEHDKPCDHDCRFTRQRLRASRRPRGETLRQHRCHKNKQSGSTTSPLLNPTPPLTNLVSYPSGSTIFILIMT
ncbi:hypothetical protein M378DRAFT_173915 [Amanita muscaria Koide BX008]|uniref:Uncharacterized protein n=1 Tax=Amanita muscaria (strain Koide BX008) TaxID=946122 RepID=A0A0C2WEN0_AMAMK|nr:hypothetical protein M378DRAFT_173915 [Amanita muscaria Koide BX008]